jgi:hypothetical protein
MQLQLDMLLLYGHQWVKTINNFIWYHKKLKYELNKNINYKSAKKHILNKPLSRFV